MVSDDYLDEPKIVPNLSYLHIVHPLPNASNLPFPPTAESNEQVVDVLAPAFMKMLDLAFDALRIGEGKKDGGWNLLITLYVPSISEASFRLTRVGTTCT